MSLSIEDTTAALERTDSGAAARAGAEGDGALIGAAKRGCMASFEKLVRRYEQRIVCYVQKRAGNAVDAEDVAQETFIKVWGALHRFEEGRAFKPWLFTIASREAISHARKSQRRGRLVDELKRMDRGGDSVDDRLEASESAGAIWKIAEGCLSEADLSAMWLRYAEEMSCADIAGVQGCTTVRVRVALSRARRRVREQWDVVRETNANGEGQT
jgi:RNA polymerase sigma-70 factor (ECF subfamily)